MQLPISQAQVVEDARAQRSADACIALIVAGSPAGADSPFRPLAELELPEGLPRWLNHTSEAAPALYHHSLRVALVASAFGAVNQLDLRKRQQLATAGLFHDLGHLKVEALATGGSDELDTAGHYQLRSHPVVSHLILSNVEGIPSAVARTVREHHERLDGSGFRPDWSNPRSAPPGSCWHWPRSWSASSTGVRLRNYPRSCAYSAASTLCTR